MFYKSNPGNYTRCEKCKHIDRENEECKVTNDKWLVPDRAGTCHQFEGVNMKVKCKNQLLSLTKDREYEVIGKEDEYFLIKNDMGIKDKYIKSIFDEIAEDEIKNPIKPSHYKAGKFDVIEFCFEHNLDFASGNVVKYIVRTGKKDKSKELEDLLKAKEYLERKIERVKANA